MRSLPRVLHLEDNPGDAAIMRAMLQPHVGELVHVTTVAEAIAALRSAAFDAAFVDLNVTDSAGLATLEAIVRERFDAVVIVVTGVADEGLALRALEIGAADYMIKGQFRPATIARVLRYSMARNSLERRLRALVQNADGIAMVNRDGEILFASPAAEEIFGRGPEEIAGTDLFTRVHPEDVPIARKAFEACLSGARVTAHEVRYLHRDGSWRYIDVTRATRFDDPESGPVVVVNFHDVTDARKARKELVALQRQYQVILNSIVSGVVGCDLDGRIAFTNPAAARMLQRNAEDLTGQSAHDVLHSTNAMNGRRHGEEDCLILSTLADGRTRYVEDDLLWRRDGTSFPACYTVAAMHEREGQISGAVVVFEDNTARRELEAQIDQARRVVSLGHVAATVAHEFNNVLMSILPFAELLRRKTALDPSLDKPMVHIFDAIKRGRRITGEILRFTNPAEPNLQTVDLAEWVRAFSDEARLLLEGRTVVVEATEPVSVRIDPMQLQQVVLNLLVNARDATSAGDAVTLGVTSAERAPYLRQHLGDAGDFAALFVSDSGHGIPPEIRDRIFEPLFTTKRAGGTGLGLAVVQQIVSKHGGRVVVDSVPGAGTTFFVLLERVDWSPPDAGGTVS